MVSCVLIKKYKMLCVYREACPVDKTKKDSSIYVCYYLTMFNYREVGNS